jgi:hypothetical protein
LHADSEHVRILLARGCPSIANFVLLVKLESGVSRVHMFFGRPISNVVFNTAGVGVLFFSTTSDPHMRSFPPSLVISRK